MLGALREDPSVEGDQNEVEVCDICGEPTEEYIKVDGLVICKNCAEDLELKAEEETSSLKCVICDWPVNRLVNVKKFYPRIIEWVCKNSNGNERDKILKSLEFLGKVDKLAICRYDFFELIRDIIARESEELAKKFEWFVKQYDFSGSLIS